jgi:eukaryotic-like serine/threonine-protein kinase
MTAATTAALGSAGASTASAAKALSARLTDWSATTRDRARDAVEDARLRREQAATARAAARPADQASPASRGRDGAGSTSLSSRTVDGLEPPVPLLPASAAEPLTRDQSRMAIGIVLLFLVFALGLAMWGLSRIPSLPGLSSDDGAGPAATAAATPGEEEETDPDGDGTPEEPAAPEAGAPLTFTDVSDFDPLGDGAERPEDLPAVLDGDDSTAWSSEGYRSAAFSNLKSGVGVVLDLGESSTLSQVALVLPSESTGTIYVTDDSAYADEGRELADDLPEAGTFSGDGTVTVDLAEGTSGRYVIVWFTEISTGGEQWYRARLAGASATS